MIGRKSPQRAHIKPSRLKGFDDFEVSLGDVMRGERATLGKSLLDVQRDLRIKAPYIVAIENSDPDVFETPGFIAGYVRSYARYLGLDPDWAFKTFCDESGFTGVHGMQPEASSTGARRETRAAARAKADADPLLASARALMPEREPLLARVNPGALGSAAVMLLLIGGLGYGGFSVFKEVQRVQVVPVEAVPGVIAQVDPLEEAVLSVADAPTDEMELPTPSIDAFDRLYRPQALDAPVMTARDGPIAAIDPDSVGVWVSQPDPPALDPRLTDLPVLPAPVQVVEAPAPELAIIATNPAWVRVTAADGTTLFEKILEAGERYVIPALEEPPTLRAGNSGAVYFTVDGDAFGPAGRPGAVASNIALARDSLRESFELADLEAAPELAEAIAVASAAAAGDVDSEEPPAE